LPNDAVVSPEILSELKAKLTEMIGALGLEIAISSAKAEGDTAYFNLNGKDKPGSTTRTARQAGS
jgi:hypothetical protein